ncbi:NUDIX domain-containing protein [Caminibacter pacificus]|uniref:8-oxo-dGTP diphosphatase n=1 Tax=Caminibacter pacificus TaxID=1424653 RepID=A0AAJ4RCD2_9BACT|nr:NUDIX hydrolase [Caminibacter pacificus]QCI28016.1 NUDIX hydrolase [Caminibacter pacificus]ROR39796.1 8-oxo-dGTP diphosphatase [Caminibacter pacificus]
MKLCDEAKKLNIPDWVRPTPFLTVDGIIKIFNPDFKGIVLIKRKNPPLGYALPGGFVDYGEKVEEALIREMKEETNLDVMIEKILGAYSDPNRDPRMHTASIVFVCHAFDYPKAGDDAKETFVVKLEDIPWDELVFDHKKILEDFIKN